MSIFHVSFRDSAKKASTEGGTTAPLLQEFFYGQKKAKEEVKRIFTGYKRMTPKITRELRKLDRGRQARRTEHGVEGDAVCVKREMRGFLEK